ncbi:MAG: ATP-binding protein [Cellulosilyticaceae bacterium]
MKTSIQWKIVGIYLCVVLIIMITSGSFIIYNIETSQYEKIENELESSVDTIERILGAQVGLDLQTDLEEVASKLKTVVSLNKHKIYVLDAAGKVHLGTSTEWGIGERMNPTSGVVAAAISTRSAQVAKWVHFGSSEMRENQVIDYAKPIMNSLTGEIALIIYVEADASEVYDNVISVMRAISVSSMLAMGIAIIFSAIFSRMITVPIKQLTKSSKQLASGSFNRIPIYSTDEIGQLTQSFNYMATELSRSLADISSEKSKLEKILENMADGVMAFNRQGVLVHANSVCYEMLGNHNMDHRFDYIFPKMGVDISFDDLLAGKEQCDDAATVHVEDKYFNLHFASYTNVLGESEGLVAVMQDVTTQQKLDLMRKEFVANVSHELRTPLTTVKSYTETLIDGAIDDREVAMSFLSVMEKETDRMTTLVHDLLELSRIDNRQMQLDMRPIDLKVLVKDTIEAQRIHAEKKEHALVMECEEKSDYTIVGDSARIRQVLHNILSNAIKYSIDPGRITLKLYNNHDAVVVQVQDTGIGIAQPDIDRIFERFYRVDKARSRNLGGTGLGLAIAKEMVELHGGTITMNSKVGKGTTVTLKFKRNA